MLILALMHPREIVRVGAIEALSKVKSDQQKDATKILRNMARDPDSGPLVVYEILRHFLTQESDVELIQGISENNESIRAILRQAAVNLGQIASKEGGEHAATSALIKSINRAIGIIENQAEVNKKDIQVLKGYMRELAENGSVREAAPALAFLIFYGNEEVSSAAEVALGSMSARIYQEVYGTMAGARLAQPKILDRGDIERMLSGENTNFDLLRTTLDSYGRARGETIGDIRAGERAVTDILRNLHIVVQENIKKHLLTDLQAKRLMEILEDDVVGVTQPGMFPNSHQQAGEPWENSIEGLYGLLTMDLRFRASHAVDTDNDSVEEVLKRFEREERERLPTAYDSEESGYGGVGLVEDADGLGEDERIEDEPMDVGRIPFENIVGDMRRSDISPEDLRGIVYGLTIEDIGYTVDPETGLLTADGESIFSRGFIDQALEGHLRERINKMIDDESDLRGAMDVAFSLGLLHRISSSLGYPDVQRDAPNPTPL